MRLQLAFFLGGLLSLYTSSPSLLAQTKEIVSQSQLLMVSGKVQDISGQGIPNCGVALWRRVDSTLVSACLSDVDGAFSFLNLPAADYILRIGNMLYENKVIDISLSSQNLALSPIVLQEHAQELHGVTVLAKRPLIKLQPGQVSYAVSSDPWAKNLSLYQVLQRIPMVTLSNGGVLIKGSIAPTYFINNVPAPLLNNNTLEGLKSIKADQVQEIQIITEPGVQYDGTFSGGVINIVMKRQFKSQLTGSLGTTINTRNQYGGVGSVAFQLGNVSFQGSLTYSNQIGYTERWEVNRVAPQNIQYHSFLQEKEREYYKNQNIVSSLLLSWSSGSSDLLNMGLNYLEVDTRGTGRQTHSMYAQTGALNYKFSVAELSKTIYRNLNFTSSYQHKWDKRAILLLMYQYTDLPKILDDSYLIGQAINYSGRSQRMRQTTHNGEHTLQVDFSYALKTVHKFNGGIKGVFRVNSNESELRIQDVNASWVKQLNLDDLFSHNQYVFGLYGEYQLNTERWEAKVGARNELTQERISYELQPQGNFKTNFDDWLFSTKITCKLPPHSHLSLHYRSSITRPSIRHLNPRISLQDPSYVYYGNPSLRSEKHHTWNAEWSYSKGMAFLNLTATCRYSSNAIQMDYGVRPDGVLYHSFNNDGKYRELGISSSFSYPFTQFVTGSFDAYVRNDFIGGTLNGKTTSSRGWTGGGSLSINLTLPKDYFVTLYGGYSFPNITLGGTGYNFYHCGGTISKSFLGDHLDISLTALDFLWNSKNYRRTHKTLDFYGASSYRNYGFLLELGATYRFSLQEIKIKKAAKKIQNSDVAVFSN